MKKICLLIISILVSTILIAQSPASFKYQAVLRDARGNIRANTATSIIISILQGSTTGTAVYTETHSATTDGFGLMNLEIGKGTVTLGTFYGINWGTSTYFVKVTVDGVEMGTAQLLSVPYALYANNAGNGFSGNYNDLTNKPVLFNGTWLSLIGKPTLATVSISGSYSDLANKPILFDGTWTSLTGKPTFATVAKSGSYNDLINKPNGNNIGDMQYWNDTTWVKIPVGQAGQYLQLNPSNIPSWTGAAYATLGTTSVSSITQTTAKIGSNLTNNGGATITARGVCWSTSANPTIADSKTTNGTGSGTYLSYNLSGLTGNTLYYVRTYATNSVGTSYGNQLSFSTLTTSPPSINGLVAYYPFNGNANDESVNKNNGIIVGAQLTTDRNGVANSAYLFDGISNFIKITGGLPITDNFTISFWAYSENASGYSNILGDGGSQDGGNDFLIVFRGNAIGIRADKNAQLNYEDSSPSALQNLDLVNKWVHVVWIMTPTSSTIYLNGTALITINETGSDVGYHDAFSFIGARQVWGTPDNYFKGKLDEIRIYNRALTATEIQTLYQ